MSKYCLTRRQTLIGGSFLLSSSFLNRPTKASTGIVEARMPVVVDASVRCSDAATDLAKAGVKAVVRYYAREVQPDYPEKILTGHEADALFNKGLAIILSYQHENGVIESFSEKAAKDAAKYCLNRDARHGNDPRNEGLIEHPEGTVIYFGIDNNFPPTAEVKDDDGNVVKTLDNDKIISHYFEILQEQLRNGPFRIGVYGPGRFCKILSKAGISYFWLPGSTGWEGSQQFYNGDDSVPPWHLYQKAVEVPFAYQPAEQTDPKILRVDVNILNPKAGGSVGAFMGKKLIGDRLQDDYIRANQRFLNRKQTFSQSPGGPAIKWNVEVGEKPNNYIKQISEINARRMVSLLSTADGWAKIEAIITERNSLTESEKGVPHIGFVPADSLVSIDKMPN